MYLKNLELGEIYTLPETNSSPLKIDGWKTILSVSEGLFSGAMSVYRG